MVFTRRLAAIQTFILCVTFATMAVINPHLHFIPGVVAIIQFFLFTGIAGGLTLLFYKSILREILEAQGLP